MPLKFNSNKNQIFLLLSSLVLILFALIIKIFSLDLVRILFEAGKWNVLNSLAFVSENGSLGLYQGVLDSYYFGPLFILCTGIAFFIICSVCFKESSKKVFFIAVFFYLLLTRMEVIFFPPYGDAIGGLFMEALWLLRNGFDYVKLSHQPSFVSGGPKIYLFSIYPTFLALMIKLINNPKLFLVTMHVLVFGFGALTITFFREILKKVFDKTTALLVSIIFLANPLFQSQVEVINMEVPALMFAMGAMYFLSKKNVLFAALLSILSILVKGVSLYFNATVLFVSWLLFFFDTGLKGKKRVLLWGLCSLFFIALKVFLSFFILNKKGDVAMVGFFQGWRWMYKLPMFYIYSLCLVSFFSLFVYKRFKSEPKQSFVTFFQENYTAFIMFIAAGGWFVLFINSYAGSERYRLIGLPFVIFCVVFIFVRILKSQKVLHYLLLLFMILSFVGSYGLFFPGKNTKSLVTDHLMLERSLEYRNSMKLYLMIAKEIEDHYSDYTIGAQHIITQLLKFPELGAVTKDLDLMIYSYPCTYGGIKIFRGLKEINIARTIWVGYEVAFPKEFPFPLKYPVSKYDRLIKKLQYGHRYAYIFQGGIALEKRRLYQRAALNWMAVQGKLNDQYKHRLGLDKK